MNTHPQPEKINIYLSIYQATPVKCQKCLDPKYLHTFRKSYQDPKYFYKVSHWIGWFEENRFLFFGGQTSFLHLWNIYSKRQGHTHNINFWSIISNHLDCMEFQFISLPFCLFFFFLFFLLLFLGLFFITFGFNQFWNVPVLKVSSPVLGLADQPSSDLPKSSPSWGNSCADLQPPLLLGRSPPACPARALLGLWLPPRTRSSSGRRWLWPTLPPLTAPVLLYLWIWWFCLTLLIWWIW